MRELELWNNSSNNCREDEEYKKRTAEREEKRQNLRSNKKYYYVKGDEKLEARLSKGNGKSSSFTADLDGRPRGYNEFIKNGYKLVNEDEEVIDRQTAIDIKKEHDDFYNSSYLL